MKKIVLGVTGSIAAYKSLELLRSFKKSGEDVICVLTKEATEFVAPLSFYTLSNNPVVIDFFKPYAGLPIHLELSASDLILVAPATYNFIGKVASGIADDPLSCAIAATRSPVIFVPCMETQMWENKVLQENINKLKSVGYYFIEPEIGELSTLKIGKGRFPDPNLIVNEAYRIMNVGVPLQGKKIIVTAGRTEEDLDPVRCITNKSSGRMGYAIAEEARMQGADVTLISGPSALTPPYGVRFIGVRTTSELREEVLSRVADSDILIMAAAVADYSPVQSSNKKIKSDSIDLQFKRTQDILKLVRSKNKKIFIIGFSLETENHIENAKNKLKSKSLDLIVANDVSSIGVSEARVTLIDKSLKIKRLPLLPKSEIAKKIINWIIKNYS